MIAPGTTISTPLGCDCGRTSTVHVPAPSPASATREQQRLGHRAAADVQVGVGEGDRVGEELGIVGGHQVGHAGAGREHRRLDRARRVRPGRGGGGDERRLDLARRPGRVALEQQRGGAGDVRRRHARPVEDGERPAGDPERGGEDLAARRAEVRLEQVAEGGEAPGGEAGDAFRCGRWRAPRGCGRCGSQSGRRGPRGRSAAAAPSRSAIMPPGTASSTGIPFASPGRLSTTTMPIAAGGPHARCLQRERAGAARDERDRAGERAGRQRRRAAVEVAGRPAEVARDRRAVDAHDRADVDELLVRVDPARPGSGHRRRGRTGCASARRARRARSRGAPARRRASSRAPRRRSRRAPFPASRRSRGRSRRGRCRPR